MIFDFIDDAGVIGLSTYSFKNSNNNSIRITNLGSLIEIFYNIESTYKLGKKYYNYNKLTDILSDKFYVPNF
jgi:hypothetical protein